jgi:hypothetical protein
VGRLFVGLVVICRAASWTGALETDQYYAWNRPLEDATDAINAEVNSGIEEALKRINARRRPCPCSEIARAIDARFDYAIIARMELWAMKTSLVERPRRRRRTGLQARLALRREPPLIRSADAAEPHDRGRRGPHRRRQAQPLLLRREAYQWYQRF